MAFLTVRGRRAKMIWNYFIMLLFDNFWGIFDFVVNLNFFRKYFRNYQLGKLFSKKTGSNFEKF
jgi:hypothetical protein